MKERGVFKIELKKEIPDYEEMVAVVVVAVHKQEAREMAAKEASNREREIWEDADAIEISRHGHSSADYSYVVLKSSMGS